MTRLEQARLDRLLSTEKLGELANVTGDTIRDLESGKRVARVDTLGKLAKVLDLKPSELLLPAYPEVAA